MIRRSLARSYPQPVLSGGGRPAINPAHPWVNDRLKFALWSVAGNFAGRPFDMLRGVRAQTTGTRRGHWSRAFGTYTFTGTDGSPAMGTTNTKFTALMVFEIASAQAANEDIVAYSAGTDGWRVHRRNSVDAIRFQVNSGGVASNLDGATPASWTNTLWVVLAAYMGNGVNAYLYSLRFPWGMNTRLAAAGPDLQTGGLNAFTQDSTTTLSICNTASTNFALRSFFFWNNWSPPVTQMVPGMFDVGDLVRWEPIRRYIAAGALSFNESITLGAIANIPLSGSGVVKSDSIALGAVADTPLIGGLAYDRDVTFTAQGNYALTGSGLVSQATILLATPVGFLAGRGGLPYMARVQSGASVAFATRVGPSAAMNFRPVKSLLDMQGSLGQIAKEGGME